MAKIDFFRKRLGDRLGRLKELLDKKPVVLFFLAKKNAGKGTYSKLLNEITDSRIIHISVGDLVREAGQKIKEGAADFIKEVKNFYGGPDDEEKLKKTFEYGASQTKNLLPTSAIVALIKMAISKTEGRSVIIDGFPRGKDQVDFAVKMKNEFSQKGMPSAFVEIDCADEILLARQMNRRICPKCQTPKHIELLLTEKIDYEPATGEFHLVCDNGRCGGARMVRKQGDADGPEAIRERQKIMAELFKEVKFRAGSDYLKVRNHVHVAEARKHDQNDFTTSAVLAWNESKQRVDKLFDRWVVDDEHGNKVYSRWPEPVVADLAIAIGGWLHKKIQDA